MSRYVDADELIEYAEKRKFQGVPVDVIKSKATADVEEVRHAEWIFTHYYDAYHTPVYSCSGCQKETTTHYISKYKRCPVCGAHMR